MIILKVTQKTVFHSLFERYIFGQNHKDRVNLTAPKSFRIKNRKFLRAVTFRNSYFFGGGIVQNRDIYGRATFLNQVLRHNINSFGKVTFLKKLFFQTRNIPHYLFFMESYLFRRRCFFKRGYLLQQLPFQKNYCFTTYIFRRVTISPLRFLSTTTLPIYQLLIKLAQYQLRAI